MKKTLGFYKIIATVVGCLLIVLVVVGLPLKFATSYGTGAHSVGNFLCTDVGIAHGYLYMIYLVTTFILSRQAKWQIGFTVVTLLCGTIPFASFWAELRAIRAVESDCAEQLV